MVAVSGSVLLHAVVLLAFLLPAVRMGGLSAGGSVGDGMGVGQGVDLTLYEYAQPAPRQVEVKRLDAEDLQELTQLDVAELSDEPVFEIADTVFSEFAAMKVVEVSATEPSTSERASEANRGATGVGGLTQGEGDDLWAAIAPCWRKVLDEHTVPVTLEVTFSAGGGLAEPPVILRGEASASDPKRLVSESKAIQALAECGAYPMAGGQSHVSINFPAL
ncbi:hypothetical protein ABAC460_10800 [Asticcacaulis sp. AC460]|uniref:hypothetical protein n=1 Tax=Asticcacaulis sp. AC460 TaxID=1282360 RepID=UPI0003C3E2A9|nr:hypothetical protein [Asticcacaulis sp. AC460]ESQ90229.1 hypothetical protein ABAC460_10800 [Asticcacaulis sp. AC460]